MVYNFPLHICDNVSYHFHTLNINALDAYGLYAKRVIPFPYILCLFYKYFLFKFLPGLFPMEDEENADLLSRHTGNQRDRKISTGKLI